MSIYQGIDPGSTRVRKITLKSGWRGLPSVTRGKPGKKIMILPSNMLTFRQFTFPFQDKRRIQNILPGELTDSLILPLDKMVWGISSISKDQASTVAAVREDVERFLETRENSIQIVDPEPCALARAANFNREKDALIIDLGAHKTTFCGIKEGKLEMLRVRMMGGESIDKIIASERKVSQDKGQEMKETEGIGLKPVKRFMDALFTSVSVVSPLGYEKILLTGGGSQMPGLTDYLTEKLGVPVEFFKLPGGLSPFYDVAAFGAALYDTVGGEKINLKKESNGNGKKSFYWLLLLLIPLLIFSIYLKIQESQLVKENLAIQNSMVKAVRKEFPDARHIRSALSYVKSRLKKEESGDEGPSRKIIPILNEVSECSKGLDISFYEFDAADTTIKLKGDMDSFQGVENFRVALANKFDSVEILDQKKKPDERIDFTVKINLQQEKKETGRKEK